MLCSKIAQNPRVPVLLSIAVPGTLGTRANSSPANNAYVQAAIL